VRPPSTLLRAGGVDPAAFEARCGLDDVDVARVRPAPGWMTRSWIGPVAAMTLGRTVYVRRDVLDGDPPRLALLLVHELVHVRQWREMGAVRFLARYLGDYLRGRLAGRGHAEAYRAIRAEREAVDLSRLPPLA
jgi:hypothetical protein